MGGRSARLALAIAAILLCTACVFALWTALDSHARLRNAARAAASPGAAASVLNSAVAADARAVRRTILLNAAILATALVLGALSLMRRGRSNSEIEPDPAVKVYEEAMDRLGEQRQRLVAEHRSELERLAGTLADKEAMALAGELTAGMAHEVRNSLNTIQGYARLLQKEEQSPDAAGATLAILDESEMLQSAVKSFVDFIKREELELASVDLHRLLQRVVAREERARVGPVVSIGEDLPEATLAADGDLLERAFENLIRNAREAAGASGHVEVHWHQSADRVIVSIVDDGPGLNPEVAPGRPFATTKPGGLGLGVATAMKIIGLHGGTLVLADRPKTRGCVARVDLLVTPRA